MSRLLNRQGNILEFALSSMLRRKFKNFSLLAVYTLIVFVIASLIFFVQAIKREAAGLLKEAPDLVVQRLIAGRHDLIPAAYGERIGEIRGVIAVSPRLWGYYYEPVTGANYTLMVSERQAPVPGTVRIGAGVARNQKVQTGDMLRLRTAGKAFLPLTVEGIHPGGSELLSSDLIVLSAGDFQALFNLPAGHATDLAVTVANPREQVTVAAKIAKMFPDTRPILKSEILRTYDSLFEWRGGLLVVVLAVAVLSFIIFAWDKATGLSAEERREIGILKSVGWDTSDVLLLKFWEGIVISLTAFLAGVVLAYGHVFFFSAALFEHALKGWSVIYPQYKLTPVIDAYQLTVLLFLTVFPYTAATIMPIWLAAAAPPDAAMRASS